MAGKLKQIRETSSYEKHIYITGACHFMGMQWQFSKHII